jgi:pre-60S factor REI1
MDSSYRAGCTCIGCQLVFANVDLQKQHYNSEWHRYNAKRRIADLPPISEDQFNTKVKLHQEVVF